MDPRSQEELLLELKEVKEQLEFERKRANSYAEDLRVAKEQNLAVQKQVEQEEEYITNKLMKRLEQLKREKQVLANEVEQEEEFLTNNLQKRLTQLNKEKVDLENRLEAEQEYVVNKLHKQLDQLSVEKNKLHREKVDLENQLEAEQEYIMNKLQKQVEKLGSEKKNLQKEKSDLKRQVTDLAASVDRLNKDKVNLESQMEMEEEAIVNRLQRQLQGLLSSYKNMEQKLEARGISLRDVGVQPLELQTEAWVYGRSPSRHSSGGLSADLRLSGSFSGNSSLGTLSGGVLSGPTLSGTSLSGSRRERPLSASSTSSYQNHELLFTH